MIRFVHRPIERRVIGTIDGSVSCSICSFFGEGGSTAEELQDCVWSIQPFFVLISGGMKYLLSKII